jgi:flagellin
VLFNEDGSSSLTVKGVNFDSAGLKVDEAGNDLQSDTDINNALDDLKKAADVLRAQASTFGSNLGVVNNRQEFTKGLITTLTTGSDALVVADVNEEGANLLALNTRSQLSQTALSLASQADQAVLRLF